MKNVAVFLLIMVLSLSLFACNSSPPPTAGEKAEGAIADTGAQDPTEAPTATPTRQPTKTVAPEKTPMARTGGQPPAPTNIATVIADPGPKFSAAWIYGMAHLENGYFLVTLDVPGGVTGNYHATLGDTSFDCMVLPEYPSRLYCSGITPQSGQFVVMKVFSLESEAPVFETELGIPPKPLNEEQRARLSRDSSDEPEPPPVSDMPEEPHPYPYPSP